MMTSRKLPKGTEMINPPGLGMGGKHCPFDVKQQNKMKTISEYFNKGEKTK